MPQFYIIPLDNLFVNEPTPAVDVPHVRVQDKPVGPVGPVSAQALFPNRPKPLLALIRNRLIERAIADGATRAEAEQAFDMLASERPILDWFFKEGGWLEILKAFLAIIALLKTPTATTTAV